MPRLRHRVVPLPKTAWTMQDHRVYTSGAVDEASDSVSEHVVEAGCAGDKQCNRTPQAAGRQAVKLCSSQPE